MEPMAIRELREKLHPGAQVTLIKNAAMKSLGPRTVMQRKEKEILFTSRDEKTGDLQVGYLTTSPNVQAEQDNYGFRVRLGDTIVEYLWGWCEAPPSPSDAPWGEFQRQEEDDEANGEAQWQKDIASGS